MTVKIMVFAENVVLFEKSHFNITTFTKLLTELFIYLSLVMYINA